MVSGHVAAESLLLSPQRSAGTTRRSAAVQTVSSRFGSPAFPRGDLELVPRSPHGPSILFAALKRVIRLGGWSEGRSG